MASLAKWFSKILEVWNLELHSCSMFGFPCLFHNAFLIETYWNQEFRDLACCPNIACPLVRSWRQALQISPQKLQQLGIQCARHVWHLWGTGKKARNDVINIKSAFWKAGWKGEKCQNLLKKQPVLWRFPDLGRLRAASPVVCSSLVRPVNSNGSRSV